MPFNNDLKGLVSHPLHSQNAAPYEGDNPKPETGIEAAIGRAELETSVLDSLVGSLFLRLERLLKPPAEGEGTSGDALKQFKSPVTERLDEHTLHLGAIGVRLNYLLEHLDV